MSNNKEGQLLNDVGCNVGEFKDRIFQKTRASDTEFILLFHSIRGYCYDIS